MCIQRVEHTQRGYAMPMQVQQQRKRADAWIEKCAVRIDPAQLGESKTYYA